MIKVFKEISGGFKDVDLSKNTVCGYLSTFDVKDSDGDIIQSGSFTKTILERGPKGTARIKYLQDHDTRKAVGVFTILTEDKKGLYYEAKVGSHTVGQDYLKMVNEGIITEHSIGYRTLQDGRNPEGTANIITEIMLYEGSGLQFLGANEYTPITEVKSQKDLILMFEALEKALSSGTYTDQTFIDVIIPKHNAIAEILFKTTKPGVSTLPINFDFATAIKNNFKI